MAISVGGGGGSSSTITNMSQKLVVRELVTPTVAAGASVSDFIDLTINPALIKTVYAEATTATTFEFSFREAAAPGSFEVYQDTGISTKLYDMVEFPYVSADSTTKLYFTLKNTGANASTFTIRVRAIQLTL